jgi:ribokinase
MAAAPSLVLVVGDANPDLVLRGDVEPRFGQAEQLLDGADLVIGGSAAITAHAFARLERPVALVAAVGADEFGALTLRQLARAGVGVDLIAQRAHEPTGLTVVLSRPHDRAILTRVGAIATLTGDEVRSAVAAAGPVRHVHVSSLFLQPALAAGLAAVLAELRAAGITTSLDTNDDPAGAWLGVDALLPHLDLLLPNRAEVIALGNDRDPQRAARRLAAAGPLVVVKDAANGAFLADPAGGTLVVPAHPLDPVDTTGAGDTFNAAFLDAWLDGTSPIDCLHRAVRAGALAVTAIGGTAGQPGRDDLITVGRTHDH